MSGTFLAFSRMCTISLALLALLTGQYRNPLHHLCPGPVADMALLEAEVENNCKEEAQYALVAVCANKINITQESLIIASFYAFIYPDLYSTLYQQFIW